MLIVFFVICLVCISLGIILWFKKPYSDAGSTVFAISLIVLVVVIICCLFNINKIVKANTLEQKITVYQEEMTNIENSINPVVQNYLDHEKETYTALTPDNAVIFASIYPELSSNEIVQKQLNIYNEYLISIKNLKLEIAEISTAKWWLYFGQ